MEASDVWFILSLLGILLLTSPSLGHGIATLLSNREPRFLGWLTPLEKGLYRLSGQDITREMSWKQYASALLIFNAVGWVGLFALQMCQHFLPANPEHLTAVPAALAFNTAVSFVTNTNWQAYAGETTMSYLTQMLGLGVQNFLSAATGISVLAVWARGLSRKETHLIGNFFQDLVRITLYLLLPLASLWALLLISQGVIQNFSAYLDATTVEGAIQRIPMGPAASQIAIKQLGSNGGGFFGANSAHPFENPTGLSNFLQILGILLIPCALPFTFGKLIGDKKHGSLIFSTMGCLFLLALGVALYVESFGTPILGHLPFMGGKEVRFGLGSSTLWTLATTATSNGSVNAMISSAAPLTGLLAMFNIMLGEVLFGGVGCGMYGMGLFILLTVFIAGLMVGRTPEYIGKKIEAPEIKLAVIGVLAPCAVILLFSAIACLCPAGLASVSSKGPHGLSEILYAFSSAAGNNGSAFGGLNANTDFYNLMTGVGMLIGRYSILIPVLAIAGQLAKKKRTPPSSGTFPTDTWLFGCLLAATILIVGGLTFLPALTLGPVVEHLLMLQSRIF